MNETGAGFRLRLQQGNITLKKPAKKSAAKAKKTAKTAAAKRAMPARKTAKVAAKSKVKGTRKTVAARKPKAPAKKTAKAKAAKKPAARKASAKAVAKKSAAKTSAAKKAVSKKPVAKKAAVKKTAARKVVAKKVAPKRVVAKKIAAKKVAPKKVALKKVAPKKAAARQAISAPVAGPQWPPLVMEVLKQLDDSKAEQVITIDVSKKSSVADVMVVASGRSNRHVSAIADQVVERLEQMGKKNIRVEGMPQCDWVLVDAGDLMVHVFRPEVRSFYNLEKLWSEHAPQ